MSAPGVTWLLCVDALVELFDMGFVPDALTIVPAVEDFATTCLLPEALFVFRGAFELC